MGDLQYQSTKAGEWEMRKKSISLLPKAGEFASMQSIVGAGCGSIRGWTNTWGFRIVEEKMLPLL